MEASKKKELKEQAKEILPMAGVISLENKKNGKVFIEALTNLKRLNGFKFQLKHGVHTNEALQSDWNQLGEDEFAIEVLESIKTEGKTAYQLKKELGDAKEHWVAKKRSFGEQGYN